MKNKTLPGNQKRIMSKFIFMDIMQIINKTDTLISFRSKNSSTQSWNRVLQMLKFRASVAIAG